MLDLLVVGVGVVVAIRRGLQSVVVTVEVGSMLRGVGGRFVSFLRCRGLGDEGLTFVVLLSPARQHTYNLRVPPALGCASQMLCRCGMGRRDRRRGFHQRLCSWTCDHELSLMYVLYWSSCFTGYC